jgi:hypothetical protein
MPRAGTSDTPALERRRHDDEGCDRFCCLHWRDGKQRRVGQMELGSSAARLRRRRPKRALWHRDEIQRVSALVTDLD